MKSRIWSLYIHSQLRHAVTNLKGPCTAFGRSSDCCRSVMTCISKRQDLCLCLKHSTLKPKMKTSPESPVKDSKCTETKLPR